MTATNQNCQLGFRKPYERESIKWLATECDIVNEMSGLLHEVWNINGKLLAIIEVKDNAFECWDYESVRSPLNSKDSDCKGIYSTLKDARTGLLSASSR